MSMKHHYNPSYIHHQATRITSMIREVVFGMEDGLVSTLGAITGIATATNNHFVVVLSGLVVISVESISMGVGSYLSNKSEDDVEKRKLFEEKQELKHFPDEEREELEEIYVKDGWPQDLACTMAQTASENKELFLHEMACHELSIFPQTEDAPVKKAIAMFFSYIIGGAIPLVPYILFSMRTAIIVSISATFIGLFLLGVGTTRFTKRKWWRAGFEMFVLASVAALVGYLVGQIVDAFLKNS